MRSSWVNEKGEQVRTCPRCAKVGPRHQKFCGSCGASMKPEHEALTLELGAVVDKRYRLLAKLGEGGMGSVFRVEHIRMGKIVALKMMTQELVRDRKTADRFRREAQLVSKLDHPNVISVFDSGETEQGLLYLVMEYIEGRDLGETLRDEGRFEQHRVMELMVHVLRGVEHAHAGGVIHRDLKPGNVMLASDTGAVKILDFGVATVLDTHRDGVGKITGAFDVVGTPSCMSPEQARGVTLDPRSDLYSVAAMTFELVAGRGPFIGGPLEVIGMHLTMPAPAIGWAAPDLQIRPELEAIVAKGLAKDPKDRYQSAAEMRRAFEAALGRKLPKGEPPPVFEVARREDFEAFERSFRRERLLTRLGAAAAVALGVGALSYLGGQRGEAPIARAPLEEEIEPNDLPSRANLIALDRPIKGHVGFRRVPTASDADVFELDVAEATTLAVTVSGVPNVNMVLEVLRESGPRTVPWLGVDDAPVSFGEELSDVAVSPGRYFVRLSEQHRLDEPLGAPRENSTDPYVLLVRTEEPRRFREREPNNRREEAMPVSLDAPVLGRAGTRGLTTFVREGDAPLPTWSNDLFELTAPREHERVCAALGGLPFSSLRLLALPARDDARALRSAPSVTVREGAAQGLCVTNAGAPVFEVRVDEGSTGAATYPLVFFGSGPGGVAGVVAMIDELKSSGRSVEARAILTEVLTLLARGPDSAILEAALAELR